MSESPTVAPATSSLRFSIRSLLILVTVVCMLLAPFPWLGFTYLFSVTLSTLLIACCTFSYMNKWQTSPIKLSVLGILSGFVGIGSIAFVLHSIVNLFGTIYCTSTKPKPRTFAIILMFLALIPYACAIGFGLKDYRRISALRTQYPVESLQTRLLFDNHGHTTEPLPDVPTSPLSIEVELNLASFEQRVEDDDGMWRVRALARLHNDTYRRFAAATGFGPARMAGFPQNIRATEIDFKRERAALPIPIKEFVRSSASDNTALVHQETLKDFFRPDSYGDVRDSNQVVGFEPHGPTQLDNEISAENPGDESNWQLTRLELVSLLKHDEPRVYIAETIPLMNELNSLPHRSLNEFEAQALPQLATEKDTVIDEFAGGAKMLGAVRAGNDCLQCHTGPRGKLLGAFSYEFRLVK